MHIEPGVVDGAKIALGVTTGTVSIALTAKLAIGSAVKDSSVTKLATRSVICSALVVSFFQLLPHPSVDVSEVHLILGTTLFLIFGAAPAAIGLVLGLLMQGLFFAPADLSQFGMNVTTLIIPLLAMASIARRVIPDDTAYTDLSYSQALKLSLVFQGGIVAWVAFWAIYGQGLGVENLAQIGAYGASYLVVIALEPLLDLAILAAAKSFRRFENSGLPHNRLYAKAA